MDESHSELEKLGVIEKSHNESKRPSPIDSFNLLSSQNFILKISGIDQHQNELFTRVYESDNFGNFNFKIPLHGIEGDVVALQVYELSYMKDIELYLGTYIPLKITDPKKIIICDFDKTLVDTRYSSTKEIYKSLTSPITKFPTVETSKKIITEYIDRGFHPFILSASPHFYEETMRDWLYQNGIYSAGIFLKDYRKIFSFFEDELTPKDLKIQGLYKLNHLLNILLMTGIPDELVLMGDNFEADPVIYLTLAKMLENEVDPWVIWKKVKQEESFTLSIRQNSRFLDKIFEIKNLIKKRASDGQIPCSTKIMIRKAKEDDKINVSTAILQSNISTIEMYNGNPSSVSIPVQTE